MYFVLLLAAVVLVSVVNDAQIQQEPGEGDR
jgi:hypothetical protein